MILHSLQINRFYVIKELMIKIWGIIIFCLTSFATHQYMEPQINQTEFKQVNSDAKQKRKYKYLYPSEKIDAGFFKSYEFDLRFPEIKGAPVSKNLLLGSIDYLSYKFKDSFAGKRTPDCDEDFQLIQKELPIVPTNFTEPAEGQIKYTWIGHATAVIQVGPDNFIIDPIFAEQNKKKRYRLPACQISQLPKIDVVLVSHDHTDHFQTEAIEQIEQRYHPTFVMGLGSEDILPKQSKQKTMDWMEQFAIKLKGGQYKITFLPTCHWARRGLADLNMRLWGGFIIETPQHRKFYYSGDTGYAGVFEQIGHEFGPIDLAILPIGAYEPRQFLKAQHVNPEEAVKIHKQIKSKQSVGVHWGTLAQGRQGFVQPKYDLIAACKKHNLKEGQFIAPKHGEPIVI